MRKKNKIFNIIMICSILIVLIIGGFFVAKTKGVVINDKEENSISTVEDVIGIVNVKRNGVAFRLNKGNNVLKNDEIQCEKQSSIVIKHKDNKLFAEGGSVINIKDSTDDLLYIKLSCGEIINCVTNGAFSIEFSDRNIQINNSICSVIVNSGSTDVNVFKGSVTLDNNTIEQCNSITLLGDKTTTSKTSIKQLNENDIYTLIDLCESGNTLCFSKEDLNKELDAREQEKIKNIQDGNNKIISIDSNKNTNKKDKGTNENKETTKDLETTDKNQINETSEDKNETTEIVTKNTSKTTEKNNTSENKTTQKQTTQKQTTQKQTTQKQTTQKQTTQKEPAKDIYKCTISIDCSTILSNMKDLKKGKEIFVPKNGKILPNVTVEFRNDETVFDVLKRVCEYSDIQLEYTFTPFYKSYYIQGIGHLYQFDCGSGSGWMYKVNGCVPQYGVSLYTLNDNDVIQLQYTCNYGVDIGASEK